MVKHPSCSLLARDAAQYQHSLSSFLSGRVLPLLSRYMPLAAVKATLRQSASVAQAPVDAEDMAAQHCTTHARTMLINAVLLYGD